MASRAGQAARLSSDHRLSRSDERARVSVRLFRVLFDAIPQLNGRLPKQISVVGQGVRCHIDVFVWDLRVETVLFRAGVGAF